MIEAAALAHGFPVRIGLVFEKNTSCKSKILTWNRLILFQIGLISSVEEIHVSLERQTCLLEADTNSTWFPCEN
jgi:hypothetical protein